MLVAMERACKLLSSDEKKLKGKGSNWSQWAAEGKRQKKRRFRTKNKSLWRRT